MMTILAVIKTNSLIVCGYFLIVNHITKYHKYKIVYLSKVCFSLRDYQGLTQNNESYAPLFNALECIPGLDIQYLHCLLKYCMVDILQ